MNTPYDELKSLKEWEVLEKALQELIGNQDISVTTQLDYVVGYLVKKLLKMKK